MSSVSGHCIVWIPSLLESLMDIKWVPERRPSAIQATVIHKHGDWSLFLTHVYNMFLLRLISMIKRIPMIFLVQSIILFIILIWINWETMRLLGEKAAPKSLSPPMITLDLINTPGQVPGRLQCCPQGMGCVQVALISSLNFLLSNGWVLMPELLEVYLSTDRGRRSWSCQQGQSCPALCRALVLVEQPSLCLSLPSPRAALANLQRLLESLRKSLGNWRPPEPAVSESERDNSGSACCSLHPCWWVSFPTPEEGQHLVEKKQRAGDTYHPGERSFQPAGEQVVGGQPESQGGNGDRGKSKVSLASCQKKDRTPKGICAGLKPCSVSRGRMPFFWESGDPQLSARGRNSCRAFVPGQDQEKVRLLSDTPS